MNFKFYKILQVFHFLSYLMAFFLFQVISDVYFIKPCGCHGNIHL